MTAVETQFIQHPETIPLTYYMSDTPLEYQHNKSTTHCQSGLRFYSHDYINPHQWLHLSIPLNNGHFETDVLVCWCKPAKKISKLTKGYNVGVIFTNKNTAFSARMAEQICYIEAYKKSIEENEGRTLSHDQAATEWIAKHADQFPPMVN